MGNVTSGINDQILDGVQYITTRSLRLASSKGQALESAATRGCQIRYLPFCVASETTQSFAVHQFLEKNGCDILAELDEASRKDMSEVIVMEV